MTFNLHECMVLMLYNVLQRIFRDHGAHPTLETRRLAEMIIDISIEERRKELF